MLTRRSRSNPVPDQVQQDRGGPSNQVGAGSSPTPGDPIPLVEGSAASAAQGQTRGATSSSKEEAMIIKALKKARERKKEGRRGGRDSQVELRGAGRAVSDVSRAVGR